VRVLMELKRIIINEIHDSQVILLREVEGERSFPIVIGLFEAMSIEKRIKGFQFQRPMTHDLICNAIELLGGDLQDIYINELREHTYYAKLRVKRDGEIVEVDCRPSDAIAVAVTAKVPIYVADDVIEEAIEEQ
jgi:bifunctional DNase/RNase